MERAIILISIFMLCTSLVTATTFSIGEQEETFSISPHQEVGKTIILVDDEQVASFDSLKANELQLIPTNPGTHNVEIRYIKRISYEWERPNITRNDEPALKYVKYDKDDKKVEFLITANNLVHPDDLSYGTSIKNMLKDYKVILNNYATLDVCYPRVTTGNNLFFSCKANEYANKLSITFDIGIIETTNIHLIEEITTATPQETATTTEDIILKEQIELQDTIKTKSGHMSVTIFVILMFLAFMTILFIASHHNYESKKAGTHHSVKRK